MFLNHNPLFSVYGDWLCLSFESVRNTNKILTWKTSVEVKEDFANLFKVYLVQHSVLNALNHEVFPDQ